MIGMENGKGPRTVEIDDQRYRVQALREYIEASPNGPVTRTEMSEILKLYSWNHLMQRWRFRLLRAVAATLRFLRITNKPSRWAFKGSIMTPVGRPKRR